jgi:hypothetical protein
MAKPGGRIGREISVIIEYLRRAHKLIQLHQKTLVANSGVQGVEGFSPIEILGLYVVLTQGGSAQINKSSS